METTRSATAHVIDAISRDSRASDDPKTVAHSLAALYQGNRTALHDAIRELALDYDWKDDMQPYRWLHEVAVCLARRRGAITTKT